VLCCVVLCCVVLCCVVLGCWVGVEDDAGGYSIVEMLQETALVALVRHDKPRRLQFTNSAKREIICTLNFVTPILAVRMNMQR
jgi:hypothetical protein